MARGRGKDVGVQYPKLLDLPQRRSSLQLLRIPRQRSENGLGADGGPHQNAGMVGDHADVAGTSRYPKKGGMVGGNGGGFPPGLRKERSWCRSFLSAHLASRWGNR